MPNSIWPDDDRTETLLIAARNGDTAAVSQLLERHRPAVRRLVEIRLDHKVRRRVDVSDVVQEVLVDANARLTKYLDDPAMAFHLWIRQIASDRIIDAYRRHRVSAKRDMDREQPLVQMRPDQSSVALAATLLDPELTPAAAAHNRELSASVETCISQLNDQDREIIQMRHYEHLSNQEIAEALGLTPPAASMRYLRAIKRLRELMVSLGSDESMS